MDLETYDRLIELVYEAAVDGSRWSDFVWALEDCLGGGQLVFNLWHGGELSHTTARFDPRFIERYPEFAELDPFHPLQRPTAPGAVEWSEDVIPTDELRRTAFYNELWAPLGYPAGGTMAAYIDGPSGLGLFRPRGVDAFPAHVVPLLQRLMPHLQRALKLYTRMRQADAERVALVECLDRFAEAVILLDAQGRIRATNRTADALLRRGDALGSTGEGLGVRDPRGAQALEQAIAAALDLAAFEPGDSGTPLRLLREGGGRPYEVLVVSIRLPEETFHSDPPRVGVFVVDPERAVEAPDALLARLYGLTPAESALARKIAEGMGPAEAADQLGITSGTARTRLKTVLAKTDTRRQGALVRLLSAGLAQLRSELDQSSPRLDKA